MHIFFFRVFTVFFLLGGVSVSAQTPFWKQTNGPSGGHSRLAFNSHGDIFDYSTDLLRSTDGGASWQDITPDFEKYNIYDIQIGFLNYIYIPTSLNLYRSEDNGATWNAIFTN